MQPGSLEWGKRHERLGSRLKRREFPIPILSLDSATAEQKINKERSVKLRRLRVELRRIVRERRSAEEIILKEHPLMAFHEDRRHLFMGTDPDQQFHA